MAKVFEVEHTLYCNFEPKCNISGYKSMKWKDIICKDLMFTWRTSSVLNCNKCSTPSVLDCSSAIDINSDSISTP